MLISWQMEVSITQRLNSKQIGSKKPTGSTGGRVSGANTRWDYNPIYYLSIVHCGIPDASRPFLKHSSGSHGSRCFYKMFCCRHRCIHLAALVCWACITNTLVQFLSQRWQLWWQYAAPLPHPNSPCWGQTLLIVHDVLAIEPRQPAAIHQTWTPRWNPLVIPDWRQLESLLQHQGNDELAHAWPLPQTENTFSQRQHTPSSESGWKIFLRVSRDRTSKPATTTPSEIFCKSSWGYQWQVTVGSWREKGNKSIKDSCSSDGVNVKHNF